jgi:sugar phosphate isomerase/epimerase
MNVGISTASYFNKLQIEDAVLDIGAHHVPLCEVFLNTFSEYEPDFVDMLAGRMQSTGLKAFSIHPMSMQYEPQLFSIHPRQRGDAWQLYEQVLKDGQTLGATHYVMHGPARLFGGVKNIGLTRIAPILIELADMARGYGIRLTLENVSWCIFNRPDFAVRLLDEIGTEPLRFTLDVKQAVRSGYDPVDYIEAVGDYIVNVHLCDATRLPGGTTRYDMPGFGEYDFREMFARLAEHRYTGPAFIEVYSDMYDAIPTLYESYARMTHAVQSSPLAGT